MAVKPSGSAGRVVRLLSFLGGHGESAYSLSELSRRIGADKTTCQAMLQVLVEQGFVHRDEASRTYMMGPAIAALAGTDGPRARLIRVARVEMEELTSGLDTETVATMPLPDRLLVVARIPRSALFGLSMRVGQTIPLRPPIGAVHVAWSAEERIDAWISSAGVTPGSAEAARHRRVAGLVRERGYSVTPEEALRWRLRDVLDQVADAPQDPGPQHERDELLAALATLDYEVADPDAEKSLPVGEIFAPVFDRDGRVVMAIGLVAAQPLDPATVSTLVDGLLRVTTRVTALTGGRPPQ